MNRNRAGEDPERDVPSTARVLVAMSGGLDSSITALVLKERGYDVQGVTFALIPEPEGARQTAPGCAAQSPIERAARVCRRLEIPHHVLNRTEIFRKKVVEPFCREYGAGHTPNPCVRCNALVKWPVLLEAASRLGCPKIATGHYARIRKEGSLYQILRGKDRGKDQSYALYGLPQQSLCRTLLPLGCLTKEQVRSMAKEASLPTSGTRESQDICFIPEGDYRRFLAPRLSVRPGPIRDRQGRELGTHKGIAFYTVGQRKGLGIPAGQPLYIIEKDADENLLVVGPREALRKESFSVAEVNWVSTPAPAAGSTFEAEVEVRYRARPIRGQIHVDGDGTVHVRAPRHNQAIAPGQSAVWYQGDLLLGGGIIQG